MHVRWTYIYLGNPPRPISPLMFNSGLFYKVLYDISLCHWLETNLRGNHEYLNWTYKLSERSVRVLEWTESRTLVYLQTCLLYGHYDVADSNTQWVTTYSKLSLVTAPRQNPPSMFIISPLTRVCFLKALSLFENLRKNAHRYETLSNQTMSSCSCDILTVLRQQHLDLLYGFLQNILLVTVLKIYTSTN